MADRYCSNCGQELGDEARFCPSCGRAVHEVARVPTPEADVAVPPLPGANETAAGLSPFGTTEAQDKRNALYAIGGVAAVLVVGIALAAGVQWVGVVLMLSILPALALLLRMGDQGKDQTGRLVLRAGSGQPVPEAERARLLEEEVGEYMRSGFFVRHRTATTAQPVKPKQFSFVWASCSFLLFGVVILVYLIYYAAMD